MAVAVHPFTFLFFFELFQMQAIRNANITSKVVEGTKYIGTHHGTFHCDEALAVSLLKMLPCFAEHGKLVLHFPT